MEISNRWFTVNFIIKPVCEYLSNFLDPNLKRKDDMTSIKLSTLRGTY